MSGYMMRSRLNAQRDFHTDVNHDTMHDDTIPGEYGGLVYSSGVWFKNCDSSIWKSCASGFLESILSYRQPFLRSPSFSQRRHRETLLCEKLRVLGGLVSYPGCIPNLTININNLILLITLIL